MYNLELFAIAVYYLIADELYPDFSQSYGTLPTPVTVPTAPPETGPLIEFDPK